MAQSKRGLGRGLDALLPSKQPPPTPSGASYGSGNVFVCPVEKITPQRGQPRQHYDAQALDELAQSIKEHGLIEPLVVRKRGESYELIAGERRWRASQKAGLNDVLVVVRDVSAKEAYELALIENIQREDLNAIEFAEALKRLMEEHGYTQETLADRVGKDRSTVANALRLLRLPETVRKLVVTGELSEGHARALLGAPNDRALSTLADKAVKGHLSVRQIEAMVRQAKGKSGEAGGGKGSGGKTAATRDLELRLARHLGTKCEVRDKDGKGEIVIKYSSLDELDRLLDSIL